jgi:hypothetical protein
MHAAVMPIFTLNGLYPQCVQAVVAICLVISICLLQSIADILPVKGVSSRALCISLNATDAKTMIPFGSDRWLLVVITISIEQILLRIHLY